MKVKERWEKLEKENPSKWYRNLDIMYYVLRFKIINKFKKIFHKE